LISELYEESKKVYLDTVHRALKENDYIGRVARKKPHNGSLMVWGCISSKGMDELVFIDGILDKNKYLSILKNNLIKSANNTR